MRQQKAAVAISRLANKGTCRDPFGVITRPAARRLGSLVAGGPVLLGGSGDAELSAVVRYGTDCRWRVVGHLPGPRSDLSVVPGLRGLLVVGGYDGVGSPRQVLQSQDGRRFRAFARLRTAVRYPAAITVGGSVWIFGGENRQGPVRTVQQIDLTSRTVRTAGKLPHPLAHASVLSIGGRILLIGGRTTTATSPTRCGGSARPGTTSPAQGGCLTRWATLESGRLGVAPTFLARIHGS